MDIAEINKLIPFYVAGTLEKDEREAVEAGLQKFPELSKEIEFWTNAGEATRAYVKIHKAGHLSAKQIVMYAKGKLQMDTTAMQKVEDHLRKCVDCREDIEIIRSTYLSTDILPATKHLNQIAIKHTPWYRSVYTYAAAAVIIIGVILLLPKREKEPEEIVSRQNIYANLELPYQSLTRGAMPTEMPVLALDSAATQVRLTVYVPHTSIDTLSYSLILVSPSQLQQSLPEYFLPVRSDASMDTMQVTIMRALFIEVPGTYSLVVQEVLPVSMADLTPDSYTYTFRVVNHQR